MGGMYIPRGRVPGILFIGVACSVFTIYLVLRSVGSLVDNDITSLGGGC